MSKRLLHIPALLILALILAACGSAAEVAEDLPAPEVSVLEATEIPQPTATIEIITLTDGLGRTITLEGPAQSIVSLAPSNTEMLFALGAGGQTVGRDDYSDYPEEALALSSIGDTFAGINSESIVALLPDLVLAAEITPIEYVTELETLGVTVFWLPNPVDLDGLYENLNTLAVLTGREDEANTLIDDLQARVSTVEAALAAVEEQPTVFYELDASDPAAPWTAGVGTFIDQLIVQAGGINIGAVLDGAYAQLSIEELLLQDPSIILLGDAAYGVTVESLSDRAGWSVLSAVQNGQVFPFDDSISSRPGPRLVDALEELARLLHPDLFN
jgi:iron complex transport system substrate-binding protein